MIKEEMAMSKDIRIFDTTLRDGEQSPGCSMYLNEKIEVAKQLEKLKVDVIEAGFAIASPGDLQSIKAIAECVKDSAICSLARAVKKDIDAAWESVQKANQPIIHTFIATSPVHMTYKLRMTPEEVLNQSIEMVKYAKHYTNEVEFSAEDACRSNRDFLVKIFTEVIKAGATTINIPDTVGYVLPEEMFDIVSYVMKNTTGIEKVCVSVHCHNDLGMAVANSLSAIRAGATQVECTINGLGERAGNAALEEVVMAIHTRKNLLDAVTRIDTQNIYRASRLIQTITGFQVTPNKAVVGANAFAHEAGIHQHGVLAERTTYEIMTPESIGIPQNSMVLGKHSGRHAFEERLVYLGYKLTNGELEQAFGRFKTLADKKKVVTDRDLEAIAGPGHEEAPGRYSLVNYGIQSGNQTSSTARIVLSDGTNQIEEVALGEGPIDAAFTAINKIVGRTFMLDNYALHSVTEGEDALGEAVVKIRQSDEEDSVTGRGLSTDVIEASIKAYLNGVNRYLSEV